MDYITYIAWIYPRGDSYGNYGGIWWDQGSASKSRILIGDDGTLAFQINLTVIDYNELSTAGIVPMNQWSQVGVTHDGATGYHYVNGILKYSKVEGSGTLVHSTNDPVIGMGQAGTYEFDGLIDHILIYNRVLSAT